jgi:hypothetical protein
LIPNTGVSPEDQKAQLIAGLPSQLANLHPTLQQQASALIARAGAMDKSQILNETEQLLSQQSKILGELNPQLRAAAKDKAIQVVLPNQFSKETKKNLEQEILVTSDAVVRLNDISRSFRPEYQTIQRQFGQTWNTLKDKVGALNPKDQASLTEFTRYRQNSLQNLNLTIKAITGAAMSDAEAGRIMASLPNAGTNAWDGDSPTQFKAKLDNTIQQTKYALARKQYALKNGRNWETIPLDSIPDIVRQRGKEIAKQYKLDPSKAADLNTIDRQLAAEFGILF